MAHESIGYVTVGSPLGPVQIVAGTRWETAKVANCHAVMFEALPNNVGLVYIGNEGFDKATGVGVLAILGIPTVNFIPTFSAALTLAPNALSLTQYYVDADNPGDGILATALIL